MEILHSCTGKTLFSIKTTTIKLLVETAVKNGADLRRAYLRGAYLRGADLRGADLKEANLKGAYLRGAYLGGADLGRADFRGAKGIIGFQFSGFNMYVQSEHTKIGCRYKKNKEWLKTTIDEAVNMGIQPEHYRAYKTLLKIGIKILKQEILFRKF